MCARPAEERTVEAREQGCGFVQLKRGGIPVQVREEVCVCVSVQLKREGVRVREDVCVPMQVNIYVV